MDGFGSEQHIVDKILQKKPVRFKVEDKRFAVFSPKDAQKIEPLLHYNLPFLSQFSQLNIGHNIFFHVARLPKEETH